MINIRKLHAAPSHYVSILTIICCFFLARAKTEVPVFILSGQSNMTGYASSSDLSADQKKSITNAKIYLDLANWEGDATKKRQWLTVGTGFGSNSNNIGPELFLARTLCDSMPGGKVALIKNCEGSTYLAKAEDWLPPSSNNGTGGTNYQNLMNTIDVAMKSFTKAFDTAQYTPRWAGFVWLQGEFDAGNLNYSNAYEKNLTNLINDIRAKLKVPDLPVIIPMIDAQNQWKYNSIIRAAEVAVTKKLKNVDTLDTKGFPTDNTHYKGLGQVKIGTITAQRWLHMKYNYGTVAIAYRYSDSPTSGQLQISQLSPSTLFDLSGRRICASEDKLNRSLSRSGIFIATMKRQGGLQSQKMVTLGK